MQWYRVSSIPVLLAVLLFGMTAILLLEAASSRRAGLRRPVQWLYILALAMYFAVYLYLKYRDSDPARAQYILKMLQSNGGNRSGMAFGEIDAEGNVHPDQFTQQYTFGNVLEKPFGDIWENMDDPILRGLKDRKPLLPEACRACRWLSICNGNFRARAEAVSGNFWGMDPACYLTDEERYGA